MAIPLNTASGVVYIIGWASGTVSGVTLSLSTSLLIPNGAGPERGVNRWTANVYEVGVDTNGGTTRSLRLLGANSSIIFQAGGSDKAAIGTGGFFTVLGNITTAGLGTPITVAAARVTAVTNLGSASIATFTVGAADASFRVSANCLITTSTAHSFSLDCVYTDESNVSRTLVLPVAQLAGSFVATGLITQVTGAGPYESATLQIRCKAATTITIRTSSGGTFTTVVYNAEGHISQIA